MSPEEPGTWVPQALAALCFPLEAVIEHLARTIVLV